jgi:hypothetical protein
VPTNRLEMFRLADPAANVRIAVAVPSGRAVGDEHEIEQAALGGLGQASIVIDTVTCAGVRIRVPPSRNIMAGRHDEGTEFQRSIRVAH